jgi:hypothetical protein
LDIGDIVKNSLGYPLSNTKNFLILGLIILLADLYSISLSLGIKNIYLALLIVLNILILILRCGYNIRILDSSINGSDDLPNFGNWKRMFIDGLKLLIVIIIYVIPLILIIMVVGIFMGAMIASSGTVDHSLTKMLLLIILAIVGLYYFLIYPIILTALANMVHNKKDISYALKFGEIRSKISDLGVGSFAGWYIVTVIIYAVLLGIGMGLSSVFGLVHVKFIGIIIESLLIAPFTTIFLYRSTSLMYRSALKVQEESELSEDPELTP